LVYGVLVFQKWSDRGLKKKVKWRNIDEGSDGARLVET